MRPSAEELTKHATALRRLARSLLADEQLAEDLVQQTYVTALERPPRSVPSLGAWLAQVLRRRALNWSRDHRRREARERDAARPEAESAEAAPALGADTLQACELLLAAVKELDEPQRTAVVLRYFEDLTPAQIAARIGEPKRTVQTRLYRALQRLRHRLEPHGPNCAALLPLAVRGPRTLLTGTLLMSTKNTLVAAAAVVLAAAAAWSLSLGAGRRANETEPSSAGHAAADTPEVRSGGEDAARSEVAPASRPESARPSTEDVLPLHGRVVDARELPVAGALVELRRRPTLTYTILDGELLYASEKLAQAMTGRDGRFELALVRARPAELGVSAAGFEQKVVAECYGGQDLTIVLAHGAAVEGRITAQEDGRPLSSVRVMIGRANVRPSGGQRRSVESDQDGRYRLADLEAGEHVLNVQPEVGELQRFRRLLLVAGETSTQDYAIARGETTRGRVTDAASGAPLEGAEVGIGWSLERPVRTDARGEYEMRGFPSLLHSELCARATGYSLRTTGVRPGGEHRVDFALVPAGAARGRVLDVGGRPLAEVYVAGVAGGHAFSGQGVDWQATRSAADGTFVVRGLRIDILHALWMRKAGFGSATYDFPRQPSSGEVLELGDFTLLPAGVLECRVIDTKGKPVAGCLIDLWGTNPDRVRLTSAVNQDPGGIYVSNRETRSDADGRFRFCDLAAGRYRVGVHVSAGPDEYRDDLVIRAGEVTDAGEVVLDLDLPLEGRVLDGHGQPVAGIQVLASADKPQKPEGIHSARTREDGAFAFVGLHGTYRVEARFIDSADLRSKAWSEQSLPRVAAGRTDVLLTLPPADSIRGKVLDERGEPLRGVRVFASYADERGGKHVAETSSGAAGEFTLRVPPGSRSDLWVDWNALPGTLAQTPLPDKRGRKQGVAAGSTDVVLR